MIDTSIFENKTAVYYTLGCKLNFAETSTIGKQLSAAGISKAAKGQQADICVINTAVLLKNTFSEVPLFVNAECSSGVTEELHNSALQTMASFQIKVI